MSYTKRKLLAFQMQIRELQDTVLLTYQIMSQIYHTSEKQSMHCIKQPKKDDAGKCRPHHEGLPNAL